MANNVASCLSKNWKFTLPLTPQIWQSTNAKCNDELMELIFPFFVTKQWFHDGPWKSGWRIFEPDWVYLSLSIHRKGPLGQAYGFSLGMMILVYSRMKRTPAKTGQRFRLKSLNRWERMRKAGHNNLAHFSGCWSVPSMSLLFYIWGCHWSRLKTCECHEKSDPQSTPLRSKVRLWPSNW